MKRTTPWLLLLSALLALAAVLGNHLHKSWHDIEALERDRLVHQVKIIERNLGLQMQTTSDALASVRNDLRELLKLPAAPNKRLQAVVTPALGIDAISILDREGEVIASSRQDLLGLNLRNQRRFQAISESNDPALLHISAPFRSPLGYWSITFGRSIRDADGNFAGCVLTLINPEYFEALLGSTLYAPDVRAGLIHDQGKIIYRVPDTEGLTGLDLREDKNSSFNKHLQSGEPLTMFTVNAPVSGEQRMVASQTVWPKSVKSDHLLVASASRETSKIFAQWRTDAVTMASLFSLLALVSTLGLAFYQRRQAALERLRSVSKRERQAAEQEIRKTAHSLQLAIEGGQLGVWAWDLKNNQMSGSALCWACLGLPQGTSLSFDTVMKSVHPEDRADLEAALARAIREQSDLVADFRVLWPDGSLHWLTIRARPSVGADGYSERMDGTVQEITERKLSEQRLQRSEELLRLTTEGADIGVWYWDQTTGKLEWSTICKRQFGLPEDQEGSFEHFYKVLHPDDRERVAAVLQRSQEILEDYRTEYRVLDPEGTERWLAAMGRYYLDDQGKVIGLGGVTLDISERKLAELRIAQGKQQVEALNRQLEKRAIDAETAKRAKDAFLRAISHELRTPLTHISGGTDILLRGQPDAKQEKWLRAIRKSADELLHLVEQVLFAAEAGGKVKLDRVEFSPTGFLEEVRQILVGRAESKGLALVVGATGGVPERLVGDPTRLAQALFNYVENSIKFSERGTITLSAQTLTRDEQSVVVRFTVTDTGIGISPEVRAKLFTTFEQGDSSLTRKDGGLGIGLANTRELARLMGGEVGVDDVAGGGSAFWLTARFALSPAASAAAA